jgi:hypothetical protein
MIYAGDAVTLSWEVIDADSVSIDNNIGKVNLSGEIEIWPNNAIVYTLTATNSKGSKTSKTSFYFVEESEKARVGLWVENEKIKITLIYGGNRMPPEGYSITSDVTIKVNGTKLDKSGIALSSLNIGDSLYIGGPKPMLDDDVSDLVALPDGYYLVTVIVRDTLIFEDHIGVI